MCNIGFLGCCPFLECYCLLSAFEASLGLKGKSGSVGLWVPLPLYSESEMKHTDLGLTWSLSETPMHRGSTWILCLWAQWSLYIQRSSKEGGCTYSLTGHKFKDKLVRISRQPLQSIRPSPGAFWVVEGPEWLYRWNPWEARLFRGTQCPSPAWSRTVRITDILMGQLHPRAWIFFFLGIATTFIGKALLSF